MGEYLKAGGGGQYEHCLVIVGYIVNTVSAHIYGVLRYPELRQFLITRKLLGCNE